MRFSFVFLRQNVIGGNQIIFLFREYPNTICNGTYPRFATRQIIYSNCLFLLNDCDLFNLTRQQFPEIHDDHQTIRPERF